MSQILSTYIRRGSTVVCCGIMLLPIAVDAFAATDEFTADPNFDAIPKNWVKIELSKVPAILDMISGQTLGNYEKIRTWKLTYATKSRQSVKADYANAISASQHGSALTQTFDSTDQFAIDTQSDKIYRSRESQELKHFKEGSDEIVEIPNVKPYSARSIVTSEDYLEFFPDQVWSEFSVLQGHPEAMRKLTAFRKSAESAERLTLGDLTDPPDFFSLNGRHGDLVFLC